MVKLKIDPSKRYDQVTWAMAHDSHTATRNYSDNENVPSFADQSEIVHNQLKGGIRTVRISTSNAVNPSSILLYGDEVIVQHTIALGKFKNYLVQVVDFLAKNKHEIVTIIDEGNNDTGWSSEKYFKEVAKVYADLLGGTVDKPGSEAKTHVYIPGSDNSVWPTLNDMIKNNTRLVVFMEKPQNDTNYKWMIPAYYNIKDEHSKALIGMNIYTVYGWNRDGYTTKESMKDKERWPKSGNPNLYLFNHYFYDKKTLAEDESSRGYNHLTVGFRLVRDTLNVWNHLKIRPNFINVDFYQGVWGWDSLLIPLVNAMNSAENAIDAANAMKGILLPGGSGGDYQSKCQNLKLIMKTTAKKVDKTSVAASCDVTHFGPLDGLGNDNGQLVQVALPFDLENFPLKYLPKGSYHDSCEDTVLTLSGQVLDDSTNSWKEFTLDLTNYEKGYIIAQHGQVTIVPKDHLIPPDHKWLEKVRKGDKDLKYADFYQADLTDVDFTGADLRYADLSRANTLRTKFTKAKLSHTDFSYVDFNRTGASIGDADGAHMEKLILSHAISHGAVFEGFDLSGWDFREADLTRANFKNAKLIGANLDGADLDGADLTGANLTGANLTNVKGQYTK